ncbi:hypothetical protein [Rossellomorea sp. DUT-2]|uniref:hypothetical protein n=1 Tax=Rossellomorea sp. DUT-2 TaxID=3412021 RepID=UPI003D176638
MEDVAEEEMIMSWELKITVEDVVVIEEDAIEDVAVAYSNSWEWNSVLKRSSSYT